MTNTQSLAIVRKRTLLARVAALGGRILLRRATGDERRLSSALRHDLRLFVAHFRFPFLLVVFVNDIGSYRYQAETWRVNFIWFFSSTTRI